MNRQFSPSKASLLLAGLACALFLLSAWSSALPDGLESIAEEAGFTEGDPLLSVSLFDLLPREWMARATGVVVAGILVRTLAGLLRKSSGTKSEW